VASSGKLNKSPKYNYFFRKLAGQITDDSEMALSLASSLIRCQGFNQADVATAYVSWYASKPPDAGMATTVALSMRKFLLI
jgi:ADP-ribosyl-[dinitrogen reductase] hydrolase